MYLIWYKVCNRWRKPFFSFDQPYARMWSREL